MIFKRKKNAMQVAESRRKELYDYISTHLQNTSQKEIIDFLKKHGWKKSTVEQMIKTVQREVAEGKSVKKTQPKISDKNIHKEKLADVIPENIEDLAEEISITVEESAYPEKEREYVEKYVVQTSNFPVNVGIFNTTKAYTPVYDLKIKQISKETEAVLERIREELISQVSLGALELAEAESSAKIKKKFEKAILDLIDKYFIDLDVVTRSYLSSYLIQKALGLGMIEFLLQDANIEEIVVNNAKEPIWIYHKKHGWLQTTVRINQEKLIKHYAASIARKEGKQISVLAPLLDAHIESGDRVNATLQPVSVKGNTITIRKFAAKPWTITDMIKNNTISAEGAALIWLGMQYEMSTIICGGTASGKTSFLNVLSSFFPPNNRILSIEDTRELKLPSFLHWVPMLTKLPNAEGKGEISMLDLLVNALRQRPDRILVGEIRKKREAEVLLEAIHTGHSVYGTFHANDVPEAITRLTNPPINLPKTLLPAVNLVVAQTRNRRTGIRRTFQISEVTAEGEANILAQLDVRNDKLDVDLSKSKVLLEEFEKFVGLSREEIEKDLKEKGEVLKYLVKKDINDVEDVGRVIAGYYTNKEGLLKQIRGSGK